jgi:hypothetical protein
METSPARRRRQEKKRRQEEAQWAARSGPVIVRKLDPADVAHQADEASSSAATDD